MDVVTFDQDGGRRIQSAVLGFEHALRDRVGRAKGPVWLEDGATSLTPDLFAGIISTQSINAGVTVSPVALVQAQLQGSTFTFNGTNTITGTYSAASPPVWRISFNIFWSGWSGGGNTGQVQVSFQGIVTGATRLLNRAASSTMFPTAAFVGGAYQSGCIEVVPEFASPTSITVEAVNGTNKNLTFGGYVGLSVLH
jgi:hypothetical protein